jgi:hypothetical protein
MPTHAQVKPKYRKALLRFKQSEVERAIRGMQAMGLQIGRVEVDPVSGKFAIAVAGAPTDEQTKPNSWDKVLIKKKG